MFFMCFTFVFFYPQYLFLDGSEIHKISLEEVLSIGTLNDDILFQWVGVVTDSQDCIYVTDGMDYSLLKFDSRGYLLGKTGGKGQGPGQFLAPRLIDGSEKFIYVTDQYIPGIQVFDKNLHFVRRIKLLMPIADMKVLSDDKIAVATFSMNKAGRLFIVDSKGNIQKKIQYSSKVSPLMMDLVDFDIDFYGNVYIGYTFRDRIEKIDIQGKKIWSKNLFGIKEIKKKRISSMIVPTQIVYKDIALDMFGNLFVLGGAFSKNRSRDVFMLSPEGRLLASFILPDTSHCIHIDSKNFLYSRANDGVTLKKFRMKYFYR
jgi:hypothetical protein